MWRDFHGTLNREHRSTHLNYSGLVSQCEFTPDPVIVAERHNTQDSHILRLKQDLLTKIISDVDDLESLYCLRQVSKRL